MKSLIAIVISFYAISSQAAWLFDSFNGVYKIGSRWCAAGDLPCANLAKVTIGYDQSELKSFLIEIYKDGSTNTIWLWEGSMGDEQAYITGDAGLSAVWTYSKGNFAVDYSSQDVSIFKTGSLSYKYSAENYKAKTLVSRDSRRFTLVK